MEWLVLGAFCALLTASVALDFHVLFALVAGWVLFNGYGLWKGHRLRDLLAMSARGIRTVRTILLIFLLIGMTTALWRGSGTIAYLVYHAAGLISPGVFPLLTFLLCCGMSFLTGTSFGTAATVGTICMAMAVTMGLSPVLTAGAILSGSFFGDRCSPMSTSALLVAAVTETDLYENIKGMIRTSWVPFGVTCGVYLALGLGHREGTFSPEILAPFAAGFRLHWTTVLPAVVIVVLCLLRKSVMVTLGLSILTAGVLCVAVQGMDVGTLLRSALLGYAPALPELEGILSGGGVVSMVGPFCIVCLSSTFAELFAGTGLLDGMKAAAHRMSGRITAFGALLVVAAITCVISCNQTLAITLSQAVCREEMDKQELAIGLENTAVIIAPLVPWSIAGAVPLATIGAPTTALLAACYLYLVPLWNLFLAIRRKKTLSE